MSAISAKTKYEHIVLDEKGTPVIAGTNMKVIELILERSAYGWSPEELYFQHPYLTLGKIHSALAYYWDHKKELDADIERRLTNAKHTEQEIEPSKIMTKLKSQGLI